MGTCSTQFVNSDVLLASYIRMSIRRIGFIVGGAIGSHTSPRSARAGRCISRGTIQDNTGAIRTSEEMTDAGTRKKTYLRDTSHRTGGELVDEGEGLLRLVGHDGGGL